MKSLLVVFACFVSPAVCLTYGFNGRKLPSPSPFPAQIQRETPRHASGFSPRTAGIPKIIFFKQLLELECLKELYKENRSKHRPRPIEALVPALRNDEQDLYRARGNPAKNEDFNRRHFWNGRIVYVPSLRPGNPERRFKNPQNRKEVFRNNLSEDLLRAESKSKPSDNEEESMRRPQVFPPAAEAPESAEESSRVLSEHPIVNFGDDKFSRHSSIVKTTTASYPENNWYQKWQSKTQNPIQPYEVEEIIEEKLRVDVDDDQNDDSSFDGGKFFEVEQESVNEDSRSQEGVIDNSISTILRGLINPEMRLLPSTEADSLDWPSHQKQITATDFETTYSKWWEHKTGMATEGTSALNDRNENHRSINFTSYESPELRKDFLSTESSKRTTQTSVVKTQTNRRQEDVTSTSALNIVGKIPLPTKGLQDSFITLLKDLVTEASEDALRPKSTAMVEYETSPEAVSSSTAQSPSSTGATVKVTKDSLDAELTTPAFKEFTDDPLSFDLLSTTTKKEEASWKNSRKMHFGTDIQEIAGASNEITESGGPEQRRSDILISDGMDDYSDEENQLSTLNYLERLRQNGSVASDPLGDGASSLVPLIPAVIDDLRGGKIPPQDVKILSEAFGKHWPSIQALSNNSNVDMLLLLKMKDEKDLESVLESFLVKGTDPTSTAEPEDTKTPDYGQGYDYMGEYPEIYKDMFGEEIEDKKNRFRPKRGQGDEAKRPTVNRELFGSIRPQGNLEGSDFNYEDAYEDPSEGDAFTIQLKKVARFHLNIRNVTLRQGNKGFYNYSLHIQ